MFHPTAVPRPIASASRFGTAPILILAALVLIPWVASAARVPRTVLVEKFGYVN